MFIYGAILIIIQLKFATSNLRLCNNLEKRLNLSDDEKSRFNLHSEYLNIILPVIIGLEKTIP